MPPAYVQGATATDQSGATIASLSKAYASDVVAGNLLIAYGAWSTTGATSGETVTDTQGNVWQQAVYQGDSNYNVALLWTVAGASGPNTVTIHYPANASFVNFFIHEVSGANALDQTATGSGAGGTISTASVSTLKASEILFGAFNTSGGTPGVGSGFTSAGTLSNQLNEYEVVSSTGSYAATATGSGNWNALTATFYQVAVAVGASQFPHRAPRA